MLINLLILMIMWGSAFPFIKVGLEGLSPGSLALLRFATASLAFVPLLAIRNNRFFPELKDIPAFALAGFVGITVYHICLNYGELEVSAGAASLIIAAGPAITAVLAFFMLHDRLSWLGWLGIAVAFSGVILTVLGDSQQLSLNRYAILIVLATAGGALFSILQKPLLTRYKPVEVSAFCCWIGTLPMLVFLPSLLSDMADVGSSAIASGIYLGIFPAALAYVVFARAIAKLPVTLVMSFIYIVPVFSLFFSWLMLGEVPTSLGLLGGAAAILGVVIVSESKRRDAKQVLAS